MRANFYWWYQCCNHLVPPEETLDHRSGRDWDGCPAGCDATTPLSDRMCVIIEDEEPSIKEPVVKEAEDFWGSHHLHKIIDVK